MNCRRLGWLEVVVKDRILYHSLSCIDRYVVRIRDRYFAKSFTSVQLFYTVIHGDTLYF